MAFGKAHDDDTKQNLARYLSIQHIMWYICISSTLMLFLLWLLPLWASFMKSFGANLTLSGGRTFVFSLVQLWGQELQECSSMSIYCRRSPELDSQWCISRTCINEPRQNAWILHSTWVFLHCRIEEIRLNDWNNITDSPFFLSDYNFSHRIDHFSFGDEAGGIIYPLDGSEIVTSFGK